MVTEDKERGSTSLVTREIQIKTTVKYYYTPTKMANILEKDENTKCG